MTVRPMEDRDLEAVASLYQAVARGGGGVSPALRDWFGRVVLGSPWSDPEIPSLVAEEDGSISGFLASHVRRISIDDRPGRLGCCGPMVVDPSARRTATGAVLLRTYLDGPQDLSITDGATEVVRGMWERLGGELAHPQSIGWVKPLRPGAFGIGLWGRARGHGRPGRAGEALGRIGDSVAEIPPIRRMLEGDREKGGAEGSGEPGLEPLTGESLAAAVPVVAARRRLRPAYDAEFAAWLLGELKAVSSRGALRARLVRSDRDGEPLGWFIYYLQSGGMSDVVSVAARDERGAGIVLDALLADARSRSAAGLRGRLEPALVAPAGRRRFLFHYAGQALVHAREPGTIALATSRDAILTRLEGEWWMDPHLL